MRGKVTKTVYINHNFWRERRAEAESDQGESAYQPNTISLGPHRNWKWVKLLFPMKLASDRFVFVPSGLALVGSPQRRRLTTQPKNASGTSSDWEKWGGSVHQHVRARACVLWYRIVGPQLPVAVYSQLPTSHTHWILCVPWVARKSSTAVSLHPIRWWCPVSGHFLLVPL